MDKQQGFFSRFRRRITDEHGDPGGRYFAILLEYLFHESPAAFLASVMPQLKVGVTGLTVKAEVILEKEGVSQVRRADLGVYDANGAIIGLIEIKEDDQNTPGNDEQVNDYVRYIADEGVAFSYVTKHVPSELSGKALEAHSIEPTYYREIHFRLKKFIGSAKGKKHAPAKGFRIAEFLLEYLEENGVVYKPLNEEELDLAGLFLRQALGLRGGPPREKTAERVARTATVFAQLIGNVEALGLQMHAVARQHFKVKFWQDYKFYPWWDTEAVAESIAEGGYDESDSLGIELCDGGTLRIWTQGKLSSSANVNCFVWFGFEFEFDSEAGSLCYKTYAAVGADARSFSGDNPKRTVIAGRKSTFPDEGEALQEIGVTLRAQIKKARKAVPAWEQILSSYDTTLERITRKKALPVE